MTLRQRILKWFYPRLMKNTSYPENKIILYNEKNILPQQSFYELHATLNNGTQLSFDTLKGKKVLIVNTASDCGYTAQYDELQILYAEQKEHLVVLGFPANDFKKQEKGSDEEIAQFCKINFGVTFPLMKKSSVVRGANQNAVFQWLTDKNKNGWNEQQPVWNFSKYLVNESGVLINFFGPAVSPLIAKETGSTSFM